MKRILVALLASIACASAFADAGSISNAGANSYQSTSNTHTGNPSTDNPYFGQ